MRSRFIIPNIGIVILLVTPVIRSDDSIDYQRQVSRFSPNIVLVATAWMKSLVNRVCDSTFVSRRCKVAIRVKQRLFPAMPKPVS